MRLPACHASRITLHGPRRRWRQSGSAVVVVLALLVIILIFVAGNIRSLYNLTRELRLVERQQTHRLQTATRATNAPPAVTVTTNNLPGPPAN